MDGLGETTVFVYDASGKLMAEYSTNVVPVQDAKVSYLTADHLGSPRINTDATGAVIARHDYHPFGEEIFTAQRTTGLNYSADSVRKQFTGYERDPETSLDFAQARMYANRLGRFTSVDPSFSSGRPSLPSSWNRFAYVRNNPLRLVDPDGRYEFGASLRDDPKLTPEENERRKKLREKFEAARLRAIANLQKIEDRYGKDSDEYKEATRGVNAFGKLGDKGVLVEEGKPTGDGDVLPEKDSNGNVVMTVRETALNKDIRALQALIGHEGTHVDDVKNGRGDNIASWGGEYAGNYVQSVLSEMENDGPTSFGGFYPTWEARGLGGGILYDPAWGIATRPVMQTPGSAATDRRFFLSEDLRREAIEKVLEKGYGLTKPR